MRLDGLVDLVEQISRASSGLFCRVVISSGRTRKSCSENWVEPWETWSVSRLRLLIAPPRARRTPSTIDLLHRDTISSISVRLLHPGLNFSCWKWRITAQSVISFVECCLNSVEKFKDEPIAAAIWLIHGVVTKPKSWLPVERIVGYDRQVWESYPLLPTNFLRSDSFWRVFNLVRQKYARKSAVGFAAPSAPRARF